MTRPGGQYGNMEDAMRRIALFLLLLAALALTMSACAPLVGEAPQESRIYATVTPSTR